MRGPLQLFKDSIALVKENYWLFIGILAGPMFLSYLATLFMPPENTGVANPGEWLIYSVLMLVSIMASIFVGAALTLALNDRSLTVKQAYSSAFPLFWRYFGVSMIVGFITGGVMLATFMVSMIVATVFTGSGPAGFAMFFVYLSLFAVLSTLIGIAVSTWFVFATFVTVLENDSVLDSIKRSRQYVRGRWFGVFGRIMLLGLFVILVGAILGGLVELFLAKSAVSEFLVLLINLAIIPVFAGYVYLMYQDVKGSPTMGAVDLAPASAAGGQ